MTVFEGNFAKTSAKFVLVVSRFNSFVVDHLQQGALDFLKMHGIEESQIDIVKVPGAFEIPLMAKKLAGLGRYQAIIALGAVIRGGTPHFEYVAGECVKGLSQVNLGSEIPVAFGVLTVDTIEQAIERAGTKAGNKGAEAAASALEMVNLLENVSQS